MREGLGKPSCLLGNKEELRGEICAKVGWKGTIVLLIAMLKT